MLGAPAALAAAPILVILTLMLARGWSAARAGLVGLTVALAVAIAAFGYGSAVHGDLGVVPAVSGALAEAVFTAVTILWIVFPALCIYQLQTRSGAIASIQGAIDRVSPDRRILAILVGWFFALFLEGAAGFGTPVALAAPLLVSAGFDRVQAVAMVMVGHAAGVSFGAVGTPVMAQVAATALPGWEIARATGFFHALLGWVLLLFLVRWARQRPHDERPAAGGVSGPTALAAACFLIPFFGFAHWVGPELPTLAGAFIGGLAFVGLERMRTARAAVRPVQPAPMPRGLLRASAPYLVLVALILTTRMLPPLREALVAMQWEWRLWGAFRGSVAPAYHPGTMLFAGLLLGALVQRVPARMVRESMRAAMGQLAGVTVALVAMLALSRVLVHADMVDALAAAAAAGVGGAWPLAAPFLGVLGTFVTGSATASNILFTDFQQATAAELHLPTVSILGAQGFGAAVGNIICPHNIIAGGATVGLGGREGEVLRWTLLPCLLYTLLGGLLALVVISR